MHRYLRVLGAALLLGAWVSCDDDEEPPPDPTGAGLADQTGEACVVPADCYDDIAAEDIQGEIQCLDRVPDGYCTHLCANDDDCCAVAGECEEDEEQVCGPFENTNMMMCFISCEDGDLDGEDPEEHCAHYHPDFICRSTGGGSDNRKVCVPSGYGACSIPNDCPGDYPNCCENYFGDLRCYDGAGAEGRECVD